MVEWLLSSLRAKYSQRGPREEEGELWSCLAICLSSLSSTSSSDTFALVPDFLLDILGEADLALPSVATSLALLLPLGARSAPSSPSWPSALAALLRPPSLLAPTLSTLSSLSLRSTPDTAPLLITLSHLLSSHPEHRDEVVAIATSLLFPDTLCYPEIFQHLATEDLEEKLELSGRPALLLAFLEGGGVPALALLAARQHAPALCAPLLALCSLLCGGPGPLRARTALGARLEAAGEASLERLAGAVEAALPLDLGVAVHPELGAGALVQGLVQHALAQGGEGAALGRLVAAVHSHHPQLLEHLAPALLTAHLSSPTSPPALLSCTLDTMVKLRQVPKLVSRLLLHLRTLASPSLAWQARDLTTLAATLPALPRVQALEMWKTLNYHLTSDILHSPSTSSSTSSLLGPLLATILSNSQLADHNLPSSLLPRITALAAATSTALAALLEQPALAAPHRALLLQVTAALAALNALFQTYRGSVLEGVAEVQGRVVLWLGEHPDYAKEQGAAYLLQASTARTTTAFIGDSSLPFVFDELSAEAAMAVVRGRGAPLPAALLERPRVCALVILDLLERSNRGCEHLYVPSLEVWARPELWGDRQGYLATSLATSLLTLLHSDVPASALDEEELARFAALPLHHLPPAVKLGGALAALGQVLRPAAGAAWRGPAARCLQASDVFRHLDAAAVLARLLGLQGEVAVLVDTVTAAVGRHTKTMLDLEQGLEALEEEVGREGGVRGLGAVVGLLASLSATLATAGEGSDKRAAAEPLADKLGKVVVKVWKKRDVENKEQEELLLRAGAELVGIVGGRAAGKVGRMLESMAEHALAAAPTGWRALLTALCRHPALLEGVPDWRARAWRLLAENYTKDSAPLVRALLASTSDPGTLRQLLGAGSPRPAMLVEVLQAEVAEACLPERAKGVTAALAEVLEEVGRGGGEVEEVPRLLEVLYSRPALVAPQLEALGLSCLALLPPSSALPALAALTAFLAHRSSLSTQVVPLVVAVVRRLLPAVTSAAAGHALGRALGLLPRHRADWAPALPALLADLLAHLPALQPEPRAALAAALLPLLPALDRHGKELLSASLAPAANEVFKQLLESFASQHKFRGKV